MTPSTLPAYSPSADPHVRRCKPDPDLVYAETQGPSLSLDTCEPLRFLPSSTSPPLASNSRLDNPNSDLSGTSHSGMNELSCFPLITTLGLCLGCLVSASLSHRKRCLAVQIDDASRVFVACNTPSPKTFEDLGEWCSEQPERLELSIIQSRVGTGRMVVSDMSLPTSRVVEILEA